LQSVFLEITVVCTALQLKSKRSLSKLNHHNQVCLQFDGLRKNGIWSAVTEYAKNSGLWKLTIN